MRTIIGAVAALSTVLTAGAAQAQTQQKTFYMRQVIKGVRTGVSAPAQTPAPAPTYTYTPGYSGYSACDNQTQYATMNSCRRSDGQAVANSFCTGAGYPSQQVQSCTPPVTYTVHDHGYGACSNGQRPHYRDCLGSDGSDGNFITMCSSTYTNNPLYESC